MMRWLSLCLSARSTPSLTCAMMMRRAHGRRQIVVRIALEVHVLGEIFRLHQLADVVEIGADTAKRRVGADRFSGGFGQIRDDETVMISAGRFDRHPPQERVIQIGRFQPRNVGRDLEERARASASRRRRSWR